MTDLFARLDAGGDFQFDRVPIDARQADCSTKRRGGETDWAIGNQRGAFPHVDWMTLQVNEEVEVPARGAAHSRFAFASYSDASPLIDSRRDLYREFPLNQRPAFAVTISTGIGD